MSVGSSVFSDLAVHHVEFHVTDAVWAARELAAQYGFAVVGSRRDEDHVSVALRQGSTVLVVTEGLTDAHPASLYVQQHGDGVADLAMRTADAAAAFEVAVSRGAGGGGGGRPAPGGGGGGPGGGAGGGGPHTQNNPRRRAE
ncbi:hypothetical protein AB0J36_12835, partial [Micromonospora sp. NPDC049662]